MRRKLLILALVGALLIPALATCTHAGGGESGPAPKEDQPVSSDGGSIAAALGDERLAAALADPANADVAYVDYALMTLLHFTKRIDDPDDVLFVLDSLAEVNVSDEVGVRAEDAGDRFVITYEDGTTSTIEFELGYLIDKDGTPRVIEEAEGLWWLIQSLQDAELEGGETSRQGVEGTSLAELVADEGLTELIADPTLAKDATVSYVIESGGESKAFETDDAAIVTRVIAGLAQVYGIERREFGPQADALHIVITTPDGATHTVRIEAGCLVAADGTYWEIAGDDALWEAVSSVVTVAQAS